MSLRSGNVPSLIQGISQQPAALRLPTQLELQENCYSTVVEGLIRRPPTEYISKVSDTALDTAFMHTINRDLEERYNAILTDADIKVFTIDGVEKTVEEIDDSYDYLDCDDPKSELKAVTVADFTFVVNSTVVPALKADLSAIRDPEGLAFVRQGNYASRYIIYIDGAIRADFTTSATVVGELATEFIAEELYDDLAAWGYSGSFTFTRQGSTIHITKDPDVDGTLRLLDNAVAISNGAAFLVDATTGETSIDFLVQNLTTATVKLQSSADGVSGWTDRASRTADGTTNVLISDLAGHTYIRGVVSAWTSGTIDLSAVYKRNSFVLQVGDSQGGASLKSFKDVTTKFTDLPATAPDGFVIKIDANPDTLAGAYYIKAVSNQSGESFGEVTWQECIAPGLTYIIDPETMPHALIRQEDGDFTFEAIEWSDRVVGDDETNGEPSFIGSPITDVNFYKNRLGFLADEFYIYSETAEYFNYWRTTVTQILDTDPIDSRVPHTKVSKLKHSVVFNTDLILFSDQTQFKIPGDVAFTPKLFRCDAVSEFEGNMTTKPVNAGKSIYFVFNREEFAGLKNLYQTESIANVMDAEDLTAHTPSYIPAGVFRLAISTLEGVTCILTDGKPSSIFVYKTAFNPGDNKKVQAAWFEWPMGDEETTKVLDASFIESTLYLLVQRGTEVFQERMLLQPARVDPGVDYVTCLDRRFQEDLDGIVSTYNIGTNSTLFENLPYEPGEFFVVATADGQVPQILDSDTDSIEVLGDYDSANMWFGETYLSRARPSTIYVRKQSAGGGVVIDEASRLQLLRGYLNYNNSGYFKVSVTPEGRSTSDYIFTGRVVGESIIGDVALRSGRFSFAILSKNDRVILEISSRKILPFRLTSLEWEGNYTKRSGG